MKVPRILSRITPQPLKNLYHLAEAVLANLFFGFPSRKLIVIGVTGTNGKTTTTQLIGSILETAGKKIALASTIDFRIGEKKWENTSKFTTLSGWQLQKFLADAVKAGCTHAVLETSSHALDQNRVWGVRYAAAVITNVTREHLDYHKTIERYRRAKRKLFEQAQELVVNLDMEKPEEFFGAKNLAKKNVLTYSTKNTEAHLLAKGIALDFKGTEFFVEGTRFFTKLPGLFNVENALAAIGAAKLLGIDLATTSRALAQVTGVPGRLELVPVAREIDVIVDYAVTPDAFEKLYELVRPLKIPGTKIIHVFGACGERDRGKRPLLGEIASNNADVVILTNEDPYFEDPQKIIDDIEKGVTKKTSEHYLRIFDRRQAIRRALELAETGDIVLVTGKGAETNMALGNERLPWNERKVIEEEWAELKTQNPS